MEISINGERTELPKADDILMGEAEDVARYLNIDMSESLPTQKLFGLVFVGLRRKNPDGVIADQIQAVRNLKIADFEGIAEEVAPASPLPVSPDANGRSETTLEPSGAPV
jgi:hypothetical protein